MSSLISFFQDFCALMNFLSVNSSPVTQVSVISFAGSLCVIVGTLLSCNLFTCLDRVGLSMSSLRILLHPGGLKRSPWSSFPAVDSNSLVGFLVLLVAEVVWLLLILVYSFVTRLPGWMTHTILCAF